MSDVAGGEVLVPYTNRVQVPLDWSPDGQTLLYREYDSKTKLDLWLLPLTGERRPSIFLRTPFGEYEARFSPDGKWVAYTNDESGRREVYVRRVGGDGEKWQVSNAGGQQPRWRRDGRELFYLSPGMKLMAVGVKLGDTFEAGTPVPLFRIESRAAQYDVAADGQRFLVNTEANAPPLPLTVVTGWATSLKR